MRKTFTTTVEEGIQKEFKLECVKNEVNMNEVLEEMMRQYVSGEIKIDIKNQK